MGASRNPLGGGAAVLAVAVVAMRSGVGGVTDWRVTSPVISEVAPDARIDEAGVGDEHFALPGGGAGWVGVIGEGSGEGAGGGDVGGDAGAGDVQPVEEGGGGEAGGADFDGGGVGVADVGDGAGDGEGGGIGGAGGRPAAVDVLKAVEVAGGGAEALEVDVEGLGGDEVGAAGTGELKAGLDGAVADGSLGVGGEDHVAAEAGVAAEEDEAGLAEGDVAPLAAEADGDLAEGGGAAEGAFELNGAGVGDVGVGAGGAGLDAEVPLLGVGEPEGEVGVGEGEGSLFVVELEVEAGAGGFDVGEAGGGAGFFLGGGGGVDVGGVEEDALEVPLAVGEVDEIDAGIGEADGGELDAAAPEGADAEGGADGVGADDGLGAEGGVFVDDEIFEGEAGEREEVEADFVEMDGAAEAVADAVGDALLIAIDADERREEDEEKDRQGCEGEIEKAAEGAGAERRRAVCVDGFAILVGWIDFLHEFLSSQLSVLRCQCRW